MRKYAGIGSRKTPQEIQDFMTEFGRQSARKGWLLRSGHATGADQAFEKGCLEEKGPKEIFLPWEGFEGAPENDPDYIVPPFSQKRLELAMRFHRKWHELGQGAKVLHMRNGCQIFGLRMDDPIDFGVCWTPKGLGGGGTGQALRIARAYHIPIVDLGRAKGFSDLEKLLRDMG